MSDVIDWFEYLFGKKAKIVIFIITIFIIYFSIAFIAHLFPFSIATGVMEKVTSPERIVQNYEWFEDHYQQILAQKNNLKLYEENSEEYKSCKMVLNQMIGRYNARSKQITRNLWKSKDLPYQIEE